MESPLNLAFIATFYSNLKPSCPTSMRSMVLFRLPCIFSSFKFGDFFWLILRPITCQYGYELIILETTFHEFILGRKTITIKIHFSKNILGSCIRGYCLKSNYCNILDQYHLYVVNIPWFTYLEFTCTQANSATAGTLNEEATFDLLLFMLSGN